MWLPSGQAADGFGMHAQGRSSLRSPGQPFIVSEDVTFSADGTKLVVGDYGSTVRCWSISTGSSEVFTAAFPPVFHPAQAVRVALSPDGWHLATALWDGTVCLWRLPDGVPVAYTVSAGGATIPALSPDQRFVLPRGVTHRSGTQLDTRVYEADSGRAAGPILDPGGILLDAAFSPDGASVATASSTARTPGERNQRLFEPDGKAGNVQLWDWKTGRRLAGPIPTPSEPRGLAFRPGGGMLAVVCADYRVILVAPRTGTITHHLDPGVRTRPQNANQYFSNGEARFSPDGRFLVTWEMSSHVHVWDPDRAQPLHTLPHDERVHHVSFCPTDPGLMATAGWGNDARIWNLVTGQLLAALKHPQWVWPSHFSADGTELTTGAGDGMLRVWDWRAGKLKNGWALHYYPLLDFYFTADDRWLVTVGDKDLQITDWRTKTPAAPPWKLQSDVNLAVTIPSGDRRAIVGGFSNSLVGYDLELMLTPVKAPVEDLVRLAEVVSAPDLEPGQRRAADRS